MYVFGAFYLKHDKSKGATRWSQNRHLAEGSVTNLGGVSVTSQRVLFSTQVLNSGSSKKEAGGVFPISGDSPDSTKTLLAKGPLNETRHCFPVKRLWVDACQPTNISLLMFLFYFLSPSGLPTSNMQHGLTGDFTRLEV